MKKKIPEFRSDEEAEAFLEQDLSEYDFSQFKPAQFTFEGEAKRLKSELKARFLKETQNQKKI